MPNRIKELRKKSKLSQNDIAHKLKITRQAVSFYEKGERNPSEATWKELADYFHVSVPYLKGQYSKASLIKLIQHGYIESLHDKDPFKPKETIKSNKKIIQIGQEPKITYYLLNESVNKYLFFANKYDSSTTFGSILKRLSATFNLKSLKFKEKAYNFSLLESEKLNSIDFWQETFSFLFDNASPNIRLLLSSTDLTDLQALQILITEINTKSELISTPKNQAVYALLGIWKMPQTVYKPFNK